MFGFILERIENITRGKKCCLPTFSLSNSTVKLVLETTYIKRPPALRDYCSDTKTLLKSTL